MTLAEHLHELCIRGRRERRLGDLIANLIEPQSSVLDIGCGDGRIARRVATLCSASAVHGAEVLTRNDAVIPVTRFDGYALPFANRTFDIALMIDVIHHTVRQNALLAEAIRVSRRAVVIKDHLSDGWLPSKILRLMDCTGNRRFHVPLPYNYLTRAQWKRLWDGSGVQVTAFITDLHLYPIPITWVCDQSLHFIARVEKTDEPNRAD